MDPTTRLTDDYGVSHLQAIVLGLLDEGYDTSLHKETLRIGVGGRVHFLLRIWYDEQIIIEYATPIGDRDKLELSRIHAKIGIDSLFARSRKHVDLNDPNSIPNLFATVKEVMFMLDFPLATDNHETWNEC